MNNQECKARQKIIDVNSNEPVFYPYSIKVNKCSINNPYAKICIPDITKNIQFYSIWCKELMKQGVRSGMKLVNVFVD